MSAIRTSARGGRDAKRFAKHERFTDSLYDQGVLTRPEDARAAALSRYLNASEAIQFSDCEAKIDAGLQTFVEVGNALLTIRDNRLYRERHKTFEDYCQERWQMTRRNADRLIDASQVVENLRPIGLIPANEAQARELVSLNPDEQRVVWEIVKQTAPKGKVTAQHVKSVKKVLKEVVVTQAIDPGTGEQIPVIAAALKPAVIEETYERMQRQEIHIDESNARREQRAAEKLAAQPAPEPTSTEPTEPLFSFEIVGKSEPFTLIMRATGLTELEVATLQTRLQTPIAKFRKDRSTGKINKAELEDPTQELQAS